MIRQRLASAGTVVLVACALVVTGLAVRRELFQPPTVATEHVPDWRHFSEAGHRMGPNRAPVTLVVFSDFECPACGTLAAHLRAIRAAHPDRVQVVYRHFPIAAHPYAYAAAQASECAAQQGRFEAYHDRLFAAPGTLGRQHWTELARAAAVPDTLVFQRCMTDSRARQLIAGIIARDTADANRLGLRVTPTLLINDQEVQGVPRLATLDALLARAAARGAE